MQNEKLQATVRELEQELLALQTIDEATRQRLQRSVDELRAALRDDQSTETERNSMVAQLQKSIEEFEGSHPTLISIIGRLADGLAQMGI